MPQRNRATITTAPMAVAVICHQAARLLPGWGGVTSGKFRMGSFSNELMVDEPMNRPGAYRAPGRLCRETTRPYYSEPPLFGGAGVNGCGDDEPEPVVLGGVAGRLGVLAVLEGEEPLLAVLLLLFQPATIRKPISSTTATPAIQPHMPPTLSSRRTTGSLNLGSVKRGSVMGILLGSRRFASSRMEETR